MFSVSSSKKHNYATDEENHSHDCIRAVTLTSHVVRAGAFYLVDRAHKEPMATA